MGRPKNILSDTDFADGRDNRFANSVLIGRVSEIKCDDVSTNVRVIMPDRVDHENNPLITKPVPVMQVASTAKKSFAVPRVGTNVMMMKMPNGTSNYLVLGSFYTTSDPPPVDDPMLDYTVYDDGSTKEFNATTGTETHKFKGDTIWEHERGASLQFKQAVLVESTEAGMTIKALAGTILVEGELVHLKGPMKFEGNIEHIGNMTTTGTHTDANGTHQSAIVRDELLHRLEMLEARVAALEARHGD
jgi:phage baseplate assembly protein V